MTTKNTSRNKSQRAVSPVIGVILMVAITVILAAVIGAFVLEIGDQQETAPNTSFDSEQQETYIMHRDKGDINVTEVSISHAGGDVIEVSQADVTINGNVSTFGWTGEHNMNSPTARPDITPVPDFRPAAGTNEKVEFQSGASWPVHFTGQDQINCFGTEGCWPSGPTDYQGANYLWIDVKDVAAADYDAEVRLKTACASCPPLKYGSYLGKVGGNPDPSLQQGDNVRVVWTASSGGKTQTLFKYSVQ